MIRLFRKMGLFKKIGIESESERETRFQELDVRNEEKKLEAEQLGRPFIPMKYTDSWKRKTG